MCTKEDPTLVHFGFDTNGLEGENKEEFDKVKKEFCGSAYW